MDNSEPNSLGPRGASDDLTTEARLAAIESHLQQIEALLIGVAQFDSRLDQIHATLELAIGVITPGQHTMPPGSEQPPPTGGVQSRSDLGFRIVAHLRRDNHGARLVSDVSWSDMWSVRLYVTALLRNAARSGLASAESRCWCEVWAPDETGELVDAAYLDPESGVIEWQSDMDSGT
jgi:hypothetical protein